MATAIRADAASAWRDRTRYDRLLGFDRATWAWECLRRSLHAEPAAPRRVSWSMVRADPPLCVLTFGSRTRCRRDVLPLSVFDELSGFAGHVFWCGDRHAPVLALDARPACADASEPFDLRALRQPIVVLQRRGGGEHVLIADGPRCIRLEVRKGTLLDGPVSLDYHVPGDGNVEAKILTLRRLTSLCRLGRFPRSLFPPERRARRWATALRAWDGRRAGANHREIACVVLGAHVVRRDWSSESDYLHTSVKRMLRTADALIGGGWRHLLR